MNARWLVLTGILLWTVGTQARAGSGDGQRGCTPLEPSRHVVTCSNVKATGVYVHKHKWDGSLCVSTCFFGVSPAEIPSAAALDSLIRSEQCVRFEGRLYCQ